MNGRRVRLLRGLFTAAVFAVLIATACMETHKEIARVDGRGCLPHRAAEALELARNGYLLSERQRRAIEDALARALATHEEVQRAFRAGSDARERRVQRAIAGGFPPGLVRGRPEFDDTFRAEKVAEAARHRAETEAQALLGQIAEGRTGAADDLDALRDLLERGVVSGESLDAAIRTGRRASARRELARLERGLLSTVREPAFMDLLRDAGCNPEEAQRFRRLWEEQMDLVLQTARRKSARQLLAAFEQGRLPTVDEERLSILLTEACCDETEAQAYTLQWQSLMKAHERAPEETLR